MTLRCLADLVPILGASIVIGKNRNRIFSDGRPQRVAGDNNPLTRHWPEARSITPVMEASSSVDNGLDLCQQSFADVSTENLMPVRLAPDGGEDVEDISGGGGGGGGGGVLRVLDGGVALGISSSTAMDEDQWSDWEDNNEDGGEEVANRGGEITLSSLLIDEDALGITQSNTATKLTTLEVAAIRPIADNLNELDIQVKATKDEDEMDFFKDMEPVIVKREVNLFATTATETVGPNDNVTEPNKTSRLTIQTTVAMLDEDVERGVGEGGGWGDSDWE